MVAETVYKSVTYQGHGSGTLKLYDNELHFHTRETGSYDTSEKIYNLPWRKIQRRKVTKSDSDIGLVNPQLIFILMSGREAIFQVEDRVTLEVLRDDIAERLQRYRKKHPKWETEDDGGAVNRTKESTKRESQPYRMKAATTPTKESSSTAKRESQPYRMKAATTTPIKKKHVESTPMTSYKSINYQGHGSGTLKLYDNELNFHTRETGSYDTNEKIYTLPWKKIKRRKVTKSDSDIGLVNPQLIFILMSGREAIFQTEDRVTLEVLRDDIAERLSRYRKLNPNWDV